MPAQQQGQLYRTAAGYGIPWYDESGRRRRRSGFKSRSDARRWYEEIERPRLRGDVARPAEMTLNDLVERYLTAHARPRRLRRSANGSATPSAPSAGSSSVSSSG